MRMTYIDDPDEATSDPDPKIKPQALTDNSGILDLTNTLLEIDIEDIDQYANADYALLRKNGLGASDSSKVLGVSPFDTRADLIAEKARNYLTAEEKAVGDLTAVKKGVDLEPVIIDKFQKHLGIPIIKPIHMYRHIEHSWMKINFDGVTGTPEQYIPAEIKVVTYRGEKHYDRTKAFFNEKYGFGMLPEDVSQNNWSVETKAAHYGIPPYYYTQLQQQILGLNAPFGYLSVLFDKTWDLYSFYVWRDEKVLNALIVEGYKVWQQILERRGPNWQIRPGTDSTSTEL